MFLLLFTLIPALELFIIIEVGSRLGGLYTFLLIIFTGVAGFALAKNEGMATLQKINNEVRSGNMPGEHIVDGLLILVSAVLLVTPGFLTDILGLLGLFPLTRPLLRKLIIRYLKGRMVISRPGNPPGAQHWEDVTPRDDKELDD